MPHRLAVAVALAALMAGCASPSTEGEAAAGPLGGLTAATRTDLLEARASAEAHDDRLAAMCWDHLLARLDGGGIRITEIKGIASAYQKARNVRRLAAEGLSDELKIACGPMLLDSVGGLPRALPLVGGPFL